MAQDKLPASIALTVGILGAVPFGAGLGKGLAIGANSPELERLIDSIEKAAPAYFSTSTYSSMAAWTLFGAHEAIDLQQEKLPPPEKTKWTVIELAGGAATGLGVAYVLYYTGLVVGTVIGVGARLTYNSI